MELANQRLPSSPEDPTPEERILRAKLIFEESLETIRGLGVDIIINDHTPIILTSLPKEGFEFKINGPFDIVEVVDGCADLRVVTTGTLSAVGCPDSYFQEAVDQNNLAKFGPGGYRNGDGKWIKPPGHTPPPIKEMLLNLGYQFPQS